MAIVKKTHVLQVRCLPADFVVFEDACKLAGIKPAERIRRFMVEEAALMQRRAASAAAWQSTKSARAAAVATKATQASLAPQKPSVGPVRQPETLSERRKIEKAAKESRKAKKEDRY